MAGECYVSIKRGSAWRRGGGGGLHAQQARRKNWWLSFEYRPRQPWIETYNRPRPEFRVPQNSDGEGRRGRNEICLEEMNRTNKIEKKGGKNDAEWNEINGREKNTVDEKRLNWVKPEAVWYLGRATNLFELWRVTPRWRYNKRLNCNVPDKQRKTVLLLRTLKY